MPTLKEIYEDDAKYVERSGFTVEVDRAYSTVTIENAETGEMVTLQGHEADEWIDDADKDWETIGTVGYDTVELAKAKPYIDSLI